MLSSSAFSPPPPRELAGGAAQGKTARGAAAPAGNSSPPSPIIVTERDIVFDCPHCAGELVIDQEGAGMTLACSHCGKDVTVPGRSSVAAAASGAPAAPAANPPAGNSEPATPTQATPPPAFNFDGQAAEQISKRMGELKLQLTENGSQTTEMRGHVNRATIELHRLQLKLQKLLDRGTAIEAELAAAKAALERSI